MRRAALVLVAGMAACSAGPDAAGADAAPCQAGLPGVRVTFAGAPGYIGDLDLGVGSARQRFQRYRVELDDGGVPSARFPCPPGTSAGPGAVDYDYGGPGPVNTVGHADFQADPAACVEVGLTPGRDGPGRRRARLTALA